MLAAGRPRRLEMVSTPSVATVVFFLFILPSLAGFFGSFAIVLTNTACAYLYSEPAQLFFVGLVNGFEAPLFIQLLVDF
jgi:hypothetical protein